jgi:hypothetical protein
MTHIHWVARGTGIPKDRDEVNRNLQTLHTCPIKMSVPEVEGGHNHDDILGFPGDGFHDPEDAVPPETMGAHLDSGDTPMTEDETGSPSSAKKHKKSSPVPPDEGQIGPGHSKREARR